MIQLQAWSRKMEELNDAFLDAFMANSETHEFRDFLKLSPHKKELLDTLKGISTCLERFDTVDYFVFEAYEDYVKEQERLDQLVAPYTSAEVHRILMKTYAEEDAFPIVFTCYRHSFTLSQLHESFKDVAVITDLITKQYA